MWLLETVENHLKIFITMFETYDHVYCIEYFPENIMPPMLSEEANGTHLFSPMLKSIIFNEILGRSYLICAFT